MPGNWVGSDTCVVAIALLACATEVLVRRTMEDEQAVKSPVDIDALPTLTTEEWLEQHNLLEIEDVIETS